MRGGVLVLAALTLAGCKKSTMSPATLDMATCAPEAATAATAQARARVGAYYFDGWSGPLSNFHFMGLVDGPYADRQPYTGWLDDDPCIVEQQLATARAFGIDFFVFDWYWGAPQTTGGEQLNSAFEITRTLADRHGMQYAIIYVNADGPFDAPPSAWPDAVAQWVSYFRDPDYARVDGKPLFLIIDSAQLRKTFGSSAAVAAALQQLRQAAQAAGLPGVYIAGQPQLTAVGSNSWLEANLVSTFVAEGYDALTNYGYTGATEAPAEAVPYAHLANIAHWIWSGATAYSPLPFIPVVMTGWDPRPWGYDDAQWYYTRSPADVAQLVGEAADWVEANPRLRVEPAPAPPMVLLEAWNELGEGSYIVPTSGDGRAYGDALADALTRAPAKARSVLTLSDSGPSSSPRRATGRLVDGSGAPIGGATIDVTAAALDGDGLYAAFTLADSAPTAPANIQSAVIGFQLNTDLFVPSWAAGACNFNLYRMAFEVNGVDLATNGDFSSGLASWITGPPAMLVPSDRGAGQMLSVSATAAQSTALTSQPHIAITSGTPFALTAWARMQPACAGTGYFDVIFLDGNGTEAARTFVPFGSGFADLGTVATDGDGNFTADLSSLGTQATTLRAAYAGDSMHWPATAAIRN